MTVAGVRVRAAALVVVCGLAAIALPARAGPQPTAACRAAPSPGFTKVTTPDFGPGEPATVASYLVATHRNNLGLATNGATIMATDDFGCHWRESFTTERQSAGGGQSPAGVVSGLLDLADGSVAAVVNPVEITLSGDMPAASLDYLSPGLAISTDGAHSWSFVAQLPVSVRRLIAVATPRSGATPGQLYAIGIDARSQSVVLASSDTGQHWTVTSDAAASGRGQDITTIAAGPAPGQVWVGGHTLSESTDGGKTFAPVTGAPTGISGVALSRSDVAVVSEFGLYRRAATGSWRRLSRSETGTVTAAAYDAGGTLWMTATRASGGALYRVDGGGLLEMLGPLSGVTLDDVQATSVPEVVAVRSVRDGKRYGLGVFNGIGFKAHHDVTFHAPTALTFDHACYGDTNPPAPPTWNPAWTPLPANEPWVYITDNFEGGTFRIDRYGAASQVAQTPGTPEGTALDPFGRVIVSTRGAHQLLRMDPLTCRQDVIDPDLPMNESPTFDDAGNLYAVDTAGAKVWEYRWPQSAYAHRVLVHDFKADPDAQHVEGLEDVRVAPVGTHYAGDLFVELFTAGEAQPVGEGEQVVRLHRGKDGRWHRSLFWTLPADMLATGMAFLPTGELLVPDLTGSSQILRIAPDGRTNTVFAVAATSFGGQTLSRQLAKVDVTPDGMVYVSAPDASPRYCPGGKYTDLGGDPALFRFDQLGHEIDPPFTGLPHCPLGISVIHLFPALSKTILPLLPARTRSNPVLRAAANAPAAVAYAAPVPVQPPAQPVSQPQTQTQPNPQSQSQSQTNPNVGFAVGLEPEAAPQLALQDTGDLQMSRTDSRHGGPGAGLFMMSALTLGAAAGAVAWRRRTSVVECEDSGP